MGMFSHYCEIFNVIFIYAVCYGYTSYNYNMKQSCHTSSHFMNFTFYFKTSTRQGRALCFPRRKSPD